VEFGAVFFHAAQQVFEVAQIGDLHVLLVAEFLDHAVHCVAGNLPCVQRLRGAAPRARTRGQIDAVGAMVRRHVSPLRPLRSALSNFFHKSTISIAAKASSSPLLPCAPPARTCASSWRSTASTPLSTGTP